MFVFLPFLGGCIRYSPPSVSLMSADEISGLSRIKLSSGTGLSSCAALGQKRGCGCDQSRSSCFVQSESEPSASAHLMKSSFILPPSREMSTASTTWKFCDPGEAPVAATTASEGPLRHHCERDDRARLMYFS